MDIENTGIAEIKRKIGKLIITLEQQAPKNIEKLNSYIELEGIYWHKRRKNLANHSGKIGRICKKYKQINGMEQKCLYCNK